MTQKRTVLIFGAFGLAVAVLLAGIRIYLLYQYQDVVDWFNTLTLIVWPSAFYLTVMQAKAPPTVAARTVWASCGPCRSSVVQIVGRVEVTNPDAIS
jgi:cobalamin synthase